MQTIINIIETTTVTNENTGEDYQYENMIYQKSLIISDLFRNH